VSVPADRVGGSMGGVCPCRRTNSPYPAGLSSPYPGPDNRTESRPAPSARSRCARDTCGSRPPVCLPGGCRRWSISRPAAGLRAPDDAGAQIVPPARSEPLRLAGAAAHEVDQRPP